MWDFITYKCMNILLTRLIHLTKRLKIRLLCVGNLKSFPVKSSERVSPPPFRFNQPVTN